MILRSHLLSAQCESDLDFHVSEIARGNISAHAQYQCFREGRTSMSETVLCV